MKKLFIPLLLVFALAGCATNTTQENQDVQETKSEKKAENKVDYSLNMGDDEAGFLYGDESQAIVFYPLKITEKTHYDSDNMFAESVDAKAGTKFVEVGYGFINMGTEPVEYFYGPELPMIQDSQGRKFKYKSELTSEMYLESAYDIEDTLNPGIAFIGYVVYEVPEDSTGFVYTEVIDGETYEIILDEKFNID